MADKDKVKEAEHAKVDEIVEEDDEFEEFEDEGWMDRTEEAEEKQYWAEDWDNDDLDDNFAMQLRTELTANAANVPK
jgi:26 proteasome complex subunit DSS1